jgi:hypothetical protein
MKTGKNIVITISPTGDTNIEANGYFGVGCKNDTKAFEAALGSTTEQKLKPEFQQSATTPRQVNQGS